MKIVRSIQKVKYHWLNQTNQVKSIWSSTYNPWNKDSMIKLIKWIREWICFKVTFYPASKMLLAKIKQLVSNQVQKRKAKVRIVICLSKNMCRCHSTSRWQGKSREHTVQQRVGSKNGLSLSHYGLQNKSMAQDGLAPWLLPSPRLEWWWVFAPLAISA